MRHFFIIMVALSVASCATAQNELKLWPEDIPFSTGEFGEEELLERGRVSNIQVPSITVYLPEKEKTTGAAVVICPGGGYRLLAMQHEGHDIARWLNEFGVAGIVVKNRLPTSDNITNKSEVALTDAQRAVRMTRHYAEEWGLDAGKVGIMGFSAGGHLASTVGTHFDDGEADAVDPIQKESCRPDFMILMYPVISMTEDFMHKGSRRNLIGENPSEQQALLYSNEKQVTSNTPPTLLIHSSDDTGVPVANSISFYEALIANGVPAEMHVFHSGGHGYGLGRQDGTSHNLWAENAEAWLMDMVINKEK